MTIGRYSLTATVATAFVSAMLSVTAPALAQGAPEKCIQEGHKPGTAGFYHCLQETSAGDSNKTGLETKNEDAGPIVNSEPQDAITDYAGSTMDGATQPDPNILKNFTPSRGPGR